ncbi:hypothetical protein GCM10007424_01370 [Flavobacterium suaedae]|uniref:Uncharacterized protein n=1 Tax=Flavobacterium suaedae TaxID=1767027 RepID=A0ABQ1JCA8_9FLAO|nr:hypothetical protein [Flavobacterium suaedae]GGB65187.1 hypothetical protein GCM10007424_01370 [Flavobacterium suaedae]
MTKEEAESLIETARPLVGRELTYSNSRYTFVEIGTLVGTGEDGNMTYKINGTIRSITPPPHQKIPLPLQTIVRLINAS